MSRQRQRAQKYTKTTQVAFEDCRIFDQPQSVCLVKQTAFKNFRAISNQLELYGYQITIIYYIINAC